MLHELTGKFVLYLMANITVIALAVYGWSSNLFSAIIASLPNPDNPADWPASPYKIFYRTMQLWHNQKQTPPPPPNFPK